MQINIIGTAYVDGAHQVLDEYPVEEVIDLPEDLVGGPDHSDHRKERRRVPAEPATDELVHRGEPPQADEWQ